MIRILLIRHGETELTGQVLYGRMPGVHLSAKGSKQAQALAQGLKKNYHISHLISSPLDRALETARYLSEVLNLPITTEEGIIELDYGHWMGKPFEEIRESETWQHFNRLRSLVGPPGGELMLHVQARAWGALESVLSNHRGSHRPTIAMVSHGDVIRALLILLLGMPLDNIHRFDVSTASVSELVFEGKYARVVRINQTY